MFIITIIIIKKSKKNDDNIENFGPESVFFRRKNNAQTSVDPY